MAGLSACALSACDLIGDAPRGSDRPDGRPGVQVATSPTPAPRATPSAQSQAVAAFFLREQEKLLTRGLLRNDGGGPDARFGAADLARNFVQIALFDEIPGGGANRVQGSKPLRRWEKPIRMQVTFGGVITPQQRQSDVAQVSAYAARLSRATGHPISLNDRDANFHIFFLDEDSRRGSAQLLRRRVPGIDNATLRSITNMPPGVRCQMTFLTRGTGSAIDAAVILIRAEHPDILRRSCIHEELAQGLGLPNDSPAARPSIFNDDEEFGFLTTQDEMILSILYDPRLRTGMRLEQVRPIVAQLANEKFTRALN